MSDGTTVLDLAENTLRRMYPVLEKWHRNPRVPFKLEHGLGVIPPASSVLQLMAPAATEEVFAAVIIRDLNNKALKEFPLIEKYKRLMSTKEVNKKDRELVFKGIEFLLHLANIFDGGPGLI